MSINKELMKGNLTTIILSVLRHKQKYGYEIIKDLNDSSQGALQMKEGTLYPLLHHLEHEGLITSSEMLAENGRKRKYYKISKVGLKELSEKKKEWVAFKQLIDQLVTRGEVYA